MAKKTKDNVYFCILKSRSIFTFLQISPLPLDDLPYLSLHYVNKTYRKLMLSIVFHVML